MRIRYVALPLLLLTFISAPLCAEEFTPTAQDKIVPTDSKLELLWAEGEFTEGPALAPDGSIVFSDIGNTIHRFDPATKKISVYREKSGRSNGLMFNAKGELIACEGANTGGGRRISITARDGTVRALSDGFEGKRFNSPNDLAIAPNGDVYFTDPRYVGDDPRDLDFEGVFRITSDGKTTIATKDVIKPNGILISSDGKTAFVADHHPSKEQGRVLLKFDVAKDGTLTNKQTLFSFGPHRGIDGMTLDTEGNVYATAGSGERSGIYVFSPSGKHLALIKLPGDPTNCVFGGGKEASTLYITAAVPQKEGGKFGLYRIALKTRGYHVVKLD
jgi:sugar lactone lactonase YvrE